MNTANKTNPDISKYQERGLYGREGMFPKLKNLRVVQNGDEDIMGAFLGNVLDFQWCDMYENGSSFYQHV